MSTSLPTVSSEGGPILIGDYEQIHKWRGIENGGSDYELACRNAVGADLSLIGEQMLVWDFGGPGTGYIRFNRGVVTFVRTWADKEITDKEIIRLCDEIVFVPADIFLSVPSGIMIFLWAPEDGASITSTNGESGTPGGDFSMGGTAHFQQTKNAKFQVWSAKGEQSNIEFTAIQLTEFQG